MEELTAGDYCGRSFVDPDEEEDCVAYVCGLRLIAVDYESIPDVLGEL